MAARPTAALIGLVLPRAGGLRLAQELYEGLLPLAEEFGVAIAGGDTNAWDGPLAVSITLLGETTPRGPLVRSGARAGDRILATGAFGGSILGRHFDFQPRVAEVLLLHEHYQLHAGIDVSDGLSLDLGRLCDESGCGAVLQAAHVPVHADAARLAAERGDGVSPLEHALSDGEDFELILAVPPAAAAELLADRPLSVALTDIGEFVAERGLWMEDAAGRRPLARSGWEHDFS
jgi:thiamine-monophosphate kinase